ncbi:MAG: NADP-dependent isocitrate dehydrogenase [Deltaproteobacteria bacterium]|jgi:isocitrate dehydrogenase|nr:NADP-dependent isocitrate dehydrogenase [Deltaproteobacteria bacterium]
MPELITADEFHDLKVPRNPIVPFIEGDGVGPELWRAARPILEDASRKTGREISFLEVPAGEKAVKKAGSPLPQETLEALRRHRVSIKGPLATPVGGGIRSLNVAIRQALDLYACVRPVTYIPGVPSPVKRPELVDVVIFRENTEDVYAGLEWAAESPEAEALRVFLQEKLGTNLSPETALGLKPMSAFRSKRLVRLALKWALKERRPSLTLVHKGNIMKYTEGAFRRWGYEVAEKEFPQETVTEALAQDPETRLIVKDRIADNMFMQTLLRPAEYSAVATPNLNGDYLSDALAAQTGGLGVSPGANIGDGLAVFEATHGTAPKYAGKNIANPTSLILSGALMLEHLGWRDAGFLVRKAVALSLGKGILTQDLARQIPGAKSFGTREFAEMVHKELQAL